MPLWSARLRSPSTNALVAISAGISPELELPARTASSRSAATPMVVRPMVSHAPPPNSDASVQKHAAGKLSTHVRVDQWHHADATEKLVGTGRGDRSPALELHDLLPNVIESRETRSSVLKIKHPAARRCLQPQAADAWLCQEPSRERNVVQNFP